MMLRWDRVLSESLPTRAEGPGLALHCCGELAKGHWGFPPVGWAMPKVLGTPQPTFFPSHGFLAPGRCCWPPACPRDSASHQPRPNNSHKSGGCLPACCWALSSPWGERELSPGPRGCFWVSHELERGEREAAGLEPSSYLPWPERQTARRGQGERRRSGDTV